MKPEMALIAPLVEQELDRILASPQFSSADRLQRFLRYIVTATLEGNADYLKESVIGVQVFDREIGYDPKLDPVVRVTARRLREKLEQLYSSTPGATSVMIHIPKGGYVPEIIPYPVTDTPEPAVEMPVHFPVREPEAEKLVPPRPKRHTIAWIVTGLAASAAVAALVWNFRTPATRTFTGPVSRFSIDLPADQLIIPWYGNNLAFSPDGLQLAYVARQNGKLRLFLRELKNGTSTLVPDSDNASAPFFSPDGQSVAIYRPGEIRRYFLAGGSERVVGVAPRFGLFGAVWDPNQGIIFNDAPASAKNAGSSAIYQLDPHAGNRAQPIRWTPPEQQPSEARLIQQILPGGNSYLFSVNGKSRSIGVVSARDGVNTVLVDQAKGGLYIPTGHLVFWRTGNLMIAPMNLAELQLAGPPATIVTGVGDTGWQGPDIAVSHDGTLAYVPRAFQMPDRRLLWVDLSGHETPVPIPPGPLTPLDLSRDGNKLLLARFNPVSQTWSLWSYLLNNGASAQLSPESSTQVTACWSPDGNEVIYSATQSGGRSTDLFRRAADLTGTPERLTEVAGGGNLPQAISADGKWLFYLNGMQPDTKSDIWAMPLGGEGKPVPVVRTADFDSSPSISPDGKWLAYTSETAGMPDVYVRRFPGNGRLIRVSEGGGEGPLWDPGGRKIYYRRGLKMMMAPFDPVRETSGQGDPLFSGNYMTPELWVRNGLLSPDGKKFLLMRNEVDPSEGHRINIVVNWFSEVSGMFRTKGS